MTINGVPVAEIEWTTWWMLGSAAFTFIGFSGWQIGKFIVGAKAISEHDGTRPKYNWLREKILPGYLANQSFKRQVSERQLQSRIGRIFFHLMLFGLALHIGFWVYAANFMDIQGL